MIIELPPIDPLQAALGQQLRRLRQARGLSAGELAAACDLRPSRLGMAEQGRTRLTSAELHALTNALQVSLRLLMDRGADLSRLKPL